MNDNILIAGIGNIFLGDDGFGVEMASAMKKVDLPPGVRVVDYGIRGLDLAYVLLDPWKAVIFVDAIARGGEPGTLYRLSPCNKDCGEVALDPHSMDPVQVINTARAMGKLTTDIYIIGCEPQDFGDELEGRLGLSAAVQAAIPEAVRMTYELVLVLQEQACVAMC
jgi:hydrogenase maturation protease